MYSTIGDKIRRKKKKTAKVDEGGVGHENQSGDKRREAEIINRIPCSNALLLNRRASQTCRLDTRRSELRSRPRYGYTT